MEELRCNTACSELQHDVDNILDRGLPLTGTSEACMSTCALPKPGGGQRHSWILHGLLGEREAQVPDTLTRAHLFASPQSHSHSVWLWCECGRASLWLTHLLTVLLSHCASLTRSLCCCSLCLTHGAAASLCLTHCAAVSLCLTYSLCCLRQLSSTAQSPLLGHWNGRIQTKLLVIFNPHSSWSCGMALLTVRPAPFSPA